MLGASKLPLLALVLDTTAVNGTSLVENNMQYCLNLAISLSSSDLYEVWL